MLNMTIDAQGVSPYFLYVCPYNPLPIRVYIVNKINIAIMGASTSVVISIDGLYNKTFTKNLINMCTTYMHS